MTAPVAGVPVRAHPAWCDLGRCQWAIQGPHESTPMRVVAGSRAARLLLLLWQQPGEPIRLRIVTIGDMLINEVDLDLLTANRASAAIEQLLTLAVPAKDSERGSSSLQGGGTEPGSDRLGPAPAADGVER